jgi:hypothetical protein
MQEIDPAEYNDDLIIGRLRAQSSDLKVRRFSGVPEFATPDPMMQCADARELATLLQSALDIQFRERNAHDDAA